MRWVDGAIKRWTAVYIPVRRRSWQSESVRDAVGGCIARSSCPTCVHVIDASRVSDRERARRSLIRTPICPHPDSILDKSKYQNAHYEDIPRRSYQARSEWSSYQDLCDRTERPRLPERQVPWYVRIQAEFKSHLTRKQQVSFVSGAFSTDHRHRTS